MQGQGAGRLVPTEAEEAIWAPPASGSCRHPGHPWAGGHTAVGLHLHMAASALPPPNKDTCSDLGPTGPAWLLWHAPRGGAGTQQMVWAA